MKKLCLSLLVVMAIFGSSSANGDIVGTVDVGNFGPGGFVDGGTDPAAQNLIFTGSLSGSVVYGGQWGSESSTGSNDLNDNHVFDGEANYTAHTGLSTMTLTINGLIAGQQYDVAGHWRGQANAATNTPYTITGFNGGPISITRNQEVVSASDFIIVNPTGTPGTLPFGILASGVASGTSLTISMNNNADQFIVVDAFAINAVAIPEPGSLMLLGVLGLSIVSRRRKTLTV